MKYVYSSASELFKTRNIMKQLKLLKVISLLLALIPINASAHVVGKMTFDDMVQHAHACVVVKAMQSTTHKTADGVYTHTEFAVNEVAFGDVKSSITVVTQGGSYNVGKLKLAEVTAGSPLFFDGQQNLLFLDQAKDGSYRIMGVSQGVFPVQQEGATMQVNLPRSSGGLSSMSKVMDRIDRIRNEHSHGSN